MNILYLAHRIPYPPDKGDKLRAYRHLEHLSRRHRVWCACFIDQESDVEHVDALRRICVDVAAVPLNRRSAMFRGAVGLLRGSTVTESFYRDPAMNEVLERWASAVRFDVVVAFSSSMAGYAKGIRARRRVLDLCDCDSEKWLAYARASYGPMRFVYGIEGRRLRRRERAWVAGFDAALVITESEAQMLRPHVPQRKLFVVSNGVELPDIPTLPASPRGLKPAAQEEYRCGSPDSVIGFVGVMDYRPNVEAVCWFAHECWDEIRERYPGCVFRIVGRRPTQRVRSLARTAGVEVVGEVADAVAEVKQFTLSVAPLRIARGLQNKVLEAMACAKPVVLTTPTADAVRARNGEEYLIADTADQFIHAVERLLRSPSDCRTIGDNARIFVARHHSWEDHLRRFESIVTAGLQRTAPAETLSSPTTEPSPFASTLAAGICSADNAPTL